LLGPLDQVFDVALGLVAGGEMRIFAFLFRQTRPLDHAQGAVAEFGSIAIAVVGIGAHCAEVEEIAVLGRGLHLLAIEAAVGALVGAFQALRVALGAALAAGLAAFEFLDPLLDLVAGLAQPGEPLALFVVERPAIGFSVEFIEVGVDAGLVVGELLYRP